MNHQYENLPFTISVSFKRVVEAFEERLNSETNPIVQRYIEGVLAYVEQHPKLIHGFTDMEDIKANQEAIDVILDDIFPNVLSDNEIKAAIVPQTFEVLKSTQRLQKIMNDAGDKAELKVRNYEWRLDYIYSCLLILNAYYGYNIDANRPFYIDIPDANGIIRNYRMSINADFIDFTPTEQAIDITQEDYDLLLENPDDTTLWEEKFPLRSWISSGFLIVNLTDVTIDDGISDLKTQLLQNDLANYAKPSDKVVTEIFRSIYQIPDLEVGITYYDNYTFYKVPQKGIDSYILHDKESCSCREILQEINYQKLISDRVNFSISHVSNYKKKNPKSKLAENLLKSGKESCIFAPVAKGGKLLSILELVSPRKNELNSINAEKLDDVIPYIVMAVVRAKEEHTNMIKAIIQNECTTIHPSVLWAFEEEAVKYYIEKELQGYATFQDIAFANIYPLYGQIDIVSSSQTRNKSIQEDLIFQLHLLKDIFQKAHTIEEIPIYEEVVYRIDTYYEEIKLHLTAATEQKFINFIKNEISPLLIHLQGVNSEDLGELIAIYEKNTYKKTGLVYNQRRKYDETVQRLNSLLTHFIDEKQIEAQKIYPHYFERFKTDGVEHTIYVGESMVKDKQFNEIYLYNLRLWQLQLMCEMENKFYQFQADMPISIEAASLILVYNTTLGIRYRADEKKFDVDGAYNARYEIIKKRIDKAHIKGTQERVTQKGKIVIVYTQRADEREYLRYISYLQHKNYLGDKIEIVELEDVQGVIGLKAIRVEVVYHEDITKKQAVITYDDVIKSH